MDSKSTGLFTSSSEPVATQIRGLIGSLNHTTCVYTEPVNEKRVTVGMIECIDSDDIMGGVDTAIIISLAS